MSGFDPRRGITPGEEEDPRELPVFEHEENLNAEQRTHPGPSVPGEGEYLLHADDLVAGYFPGVNILDGCSLTAREGELVGIIGLTSFSVNVFMSVSAISFKLDVLTILNGYFSIER